jgi:hypothetical protein
VPNSKNAKPACMAKTMIAPNKINSVSLPDFNASKMVLPNPKNYLGLKKQEACVGLVRVST